MSPSTNYLIILLSALSISTSSSLELVGTYLKVKSGVTEYSIPPPPNCVILPDESKTTSVTGATVSIWTYKTKPSEDHWDYIVTKLRMRTRCTVYFFGAEERRILAAEEIAVTQDDLHSGKLKNMIVNITEVGMIPQSDPIEYQCSWTGTTDKQYEAYRIETVHVKFSPAGNIIYPVMIDNPESKYKLWSGRVLILNRQTIFNQCDLELSGAYPGVVTILKVISTVAIPSQKELFYINPNSPITCNNIDIYMTRGGYYVSFQDIEKSENGSRRKRSIVEEGDESSPSSIDDQPQLRNQTEPGKVSLAAQILNKALDQYFTNLEIWRRTRVYIPVYLKDIKIGTPRNHERKKRSDMTSRNPPDRLWNYQLTLTRAEMQWGLDHLKRTHEDDMLFIAKEICLSRYFEYSSSLATINQYPGKMATYITGGYHPHASYDNGLVRVNNTEILTKVQMKTPLMCRGQFCQLENPLDYWIEGSTGVLYRGQISGNRAPISFVVELRPGQFVDLIGKRPIATYSYKKLIPDYDDPLIFSFNSSELMGDIILSEQGIKEGKTLTPENTLYDGVNVGNITKKLKGWFNGIGAWVWDIILICSIILLCCFITLKILGCMMRRYYPGSGAVDKRKQEEWIKMMS